MKIRIGFVSNSSTSSFCIYGIVEQGYKITEALIKNNLIDEEKANKQYIGDVLEDVFGDTSLYWFSCGDSDYIGIGQSFLHMPDDAVCGEWKKQIEEDVNKIFGDTFSCEGHQEEFYG